MRDRLVTFGCSFTYGQGLADCLQPNGNAGPNPSAQAWPSLLSNKLNRQCINLAEPGSSNKEIWNKVLQTDLNSQDCVVVLWTFNNRWAVFTKQGIVSINHRFKERQSKAFYANLYSPEEMNIDANIRMHHIKLYLDSQGIKNYHAVVGDRQFKKEHWNTVHIASNKMETHRTTFPLASDGHHPGPLAQSTLSNELYNVIKGKT